MKKKCPVCGETFQGRPNRETCSVRCRRHIESRRRSWDLREAKAVEAEMGVFPDPTTALICQIGEKEKAEYKVLAAAIRAANGERP